MNRFINQSVAALMLAVAANSWADNHPAEAPLEPLVQVDPLSRSQGSWGQAWRDQWGLEAIGLSEQRRLQLREESLAKVTVALIDTGVDYSHPELPAHLFWRNESEKPDGQDNDGNGLVDDLIGWNFVDHNNQPWDDNGHGTHLAGTVAAEGGNGIGIEGIAPNARLMVLKALDGSGAGRGSHIAAAIRYAVAKGASIIHLSLGGDSLGALERDAVREALKANRLIVVAAGNQGRAISAGGYESLPGVLVVGALTPERKRARFSDWGENLSLMAPGVDILSLRARGSDLLLRLGGGRYQPGSAIVDSHYYRASGNSFAAPFVTGAAALLMGYAPTLSPQQLTQMLTGSSRDIAPPGVDMNTGAGVLDLAAALSISPDFKLESQLLSLEWLPERGLMLYGRTDADAFAGAQLHWGAGEKPTEWQLLAEFKQPPESRLLTTLAPDTFRAGQLVTLRLTTSHQNGRSQQSLLQLKMPSSTGEPTP